jgi:hypothetical protein
MVVLVVADAGGNRCCEELAAKMAAQLLQAIHGRLQGCLANKANQHTRWLLVKRALRAVRTHIARRKFRMTHVDLVGTRIIVGLDWIIVHRNMRTVANAWYFQIIVVLPSGGMVLTADVA